MKKLKIGSFRQEACTGDAVPRARATRWNARSARVFGCGFRTVIRQNRLLVVQRVQGDNGGCGTSQRRPPAAKDAAKLSQGFDSLGKGEQY